MQEKKKEKRLRIFLNRLFLSIESAIIRVLDRKNVGIAY
jgi:hypothetical protein